MAADRYLSRRESVALEDVSLGYRTVRLLSAAELPGSQEGYQGDEGWSSDWLVIAEEDELGDPIFADTSSERLPVFTAAHGEGVWEPVQIGDSFDGFVAGLREVSSISAGREHPVGFEENPLSDAEREKILGRIREQNPNSDPEFWESWLTAQEGS